MKQPRRKNQKAEETYFPEEYEVSVPISHDHNVEVDHIDEEFEESRFNNKKISANFSIFLT